MHGLCTALPACKFCGCTPERACALVAVQPAPLVNPYLLPPGITVVSPDAETSIVPCQWFLADGQNGYVCSNPACVDRAYAEACALAETLAEIMEVAA